MRTWITPRRGCRSGRLGGGRRHRHDEQLRAARGRRARVAAAPSSSLLDETEDNLDDGRPAASGPERDQVVADFEDELARLEAAYDLLTRRRRPGRRPSRRRRPAGEVRLQASWSAGQVVVWAAGPGTPPADQRRAGRPARGDRRPGARLEPAPAASPLPPAAPGRRAVDPGRRGARLARRRRRRPRAATASAPASPGSAGWPCAAVRLVARGAVVPDPAQRQAAATAARSTSRCAGCRRCVDDARARRARRGDARARSPRSPAPTPRAVTLDVLGAVVDAIVTRRRRPARAAGAAAGRPARRPTSPRPSSPGSTARRSRRRSPPAPRCPSGSSGGPGRSPAPAAPALVVQLDPPDRGDAWFLSVLGPGAEGTLLPDRGRARRQPGRPSRWPTSWPASSACCPVLLRPGGAAPRPGVPEPGRGVGADDRHRRRARGRRLRRPGAGAVAAQADARRCGCSPSPPARPSSAPTSSANVRWSAVFDDVELTAAEIARLAAEARPLVRSRGRWVELDRADLKEAAAALAERADQTQLTGAEILRHAVGLEGIAARRRHHRRGQRLGHRPARAGAERVADRAGHAARGLRRRAAQLPGRGARLARLPRRRRARRLPRPRHGPRQDAHRARPPRPHRRRRPGARHRPAGGRRQLGGRGRAVHARPAGRRAPRRRPGRRPTSSTPRSAGADVVITTYGTAVRDVEALGRPHVGPGRPRRGAGDQEPGQRDRPAAAPHPRPHPARPHRHADRERPRRPVGDPRLHQPRPRRRPARVHRPAVGRGRGGAAGAQRHPRVPPHQEPSPRSPPSCPTASTSSTTAR